MKISIICDSLLLKNSLEIFLKEYITSYKNCNLLISDKKIDTEKLLVVVNSSNEADIKIPFSKSSLLIDLKNIFNKNNSENKPEKESIKSIWRLERKIDKLTLEFRENLIKTLREFYEE